MVNFLKSPLKGREVLSLWEGTDIESKVALSLYESAEAILSLE